MDDLRERIEAVERALTDGEGDLTALAEGAAAAERVEGIEADVADLQEDVAELSAATQALRGYVGNVRSVNESVEERADAALAAVESLEARVDDDDPTQGSAPARGPTSGPPAAEDGRSGSAGDEAAPPGDGSARQAEPEHCRACGRPTDRTRATDGSREPPTASAGRTDQTPSSGARQTAPRRSRERIGGFDPDEAGQAVTVWEEPETSRAGQREARAEADDDAGLVGRMQDLL